MNWTIKKIRSRARHHYLWGTVNVAGDDECWEWTGDLDRDGYGMFLGERVYRMAWELFNGARIAVGIVVRHSCDNRKCCNPLHLLSGSQLENIQERVARDRGAKGVNNGRAKLTPEVVMIIANSKTSNRGEAEIHGIDERTVRDIRGGKLWSHLTKIKHIPKLGISMVSMQPKNKNRMS